MKRLAFIALVLVFSVVVLPLKAQRRTRADLLQECRVSIESNLDKAADA